MNVDFNDFLMDSRWVLLGVTTTTGNKPANGVKTTLASTWTSSPSFFCYHCNLSLPLSSSSTRNRSNAKQRMWAWLDPPTRGNVTVVVTSKNTVTSSDGGVGKSPSVVGEPDRSSIATKQKSCSSAEISLTQTGHYLQLRRRSPMIAARSTPQKW